MNITKVISGGQTGSDRGGLDFAIVYGIQHGGYCPKGRKAEDGPILDRYNLEETSTDKYPPRTRLNVQNSDPTIIFKVDDVDSKCSNLTLKSVQKYSKPYLIINPKSGLHAAVEMLNNWKWLSSQN